jgi:hypothetical protein
MEIFESMCYYLLRPSPHFVYMIQYFFCVGLFNFFNVKLSDLHCNARESHYGWRTPQLLEGLKEESQAEDIGKRKGVGVHSLICSTRGVEGRAGARGLELGRVTSLIHLLELASKLTTKWLVHIPEHLGARTSHGQHRLTWLTTARTWGKPPPSPYSILYASPRHLHPNGFLSRDSQGGVPKLSKFGLPGLWEFITPSSNLWLGRGLKKTCSSPQELFQRCVALYLHTSGSGRFPTFNGQESNCQFDSRPFFRP